MYNTPPQIKFLATPLTPVPNTYDSMTIWHYRNISSFVLLDQERISMPVRNMMMRLWTYDQCTKCDVENL